MDSFKGGTTFSLMLGGTEVLHEEWNVLKVLPRCQETCHGSQRTEVPSKKTASSPATARPSIFQDIHPPLQPGGSYPQTYHPLVIEQAPSAVEVQTGNVIAGKRKDLPRRTCPGTPQDQSACIKLRCAQDAKISARPSNTVQVVTFNNDIESPSDFQQITSRDVSPHTKPGRTPQRGYQDIPQGASTNSQLQDPTVPQLQGSNIPYTGPVAQSATIHSATETVDNSPVATSQRTPPLASRGHQDTPQGAFPNAHIQDPTVPQLQESNIPHSGQQVPGVLNETVHSATEAVHDSPLRIDQPVAPSERTSPPPLPRPVAVIQPQPPVTPRDDSTGSGLGNPNDLTFDMPVMWSPGPIPDFHQIRDSPIGFNTVNPPTLQSPPNSPYISPLRPYRRFPQRRLNTPESLNSESSGGWVEFRRQVLGTDRTNVDSNDSPIGQQRPISLTDTGFFVLSPDMIRQINEFEQRMENEPYSGQQVPSTRDETFLNGTNVMDGTPVRNIQYVATPQRTPHPPRQVTTVDPQPRPTADATLSDGGSRQIELTSRVERTVTISTPRYQYSEPPRPPSEYLHDSPQSDRSNEN